MPSSFTTRRPSTSSPDPRRLCCACRCRCPCFSCCHSRRESASVFPVVLNNRPPATNGSGHCANARLLHTMLIPAPTHRPHTIRVPQVSLLRPGAPRCTSAKLSEQLFFNERHVLVRVEQVWLMPSRSHQNSEIRSSGMISVKSNQTDAEYLAQRIKA